MPNVETSTYVNYRYTPPEGTLDPKTQQPKEPEDVLYVSEKQYKDAKSEADKIGATVDILKQQSFIVTTPESIAEILGNEQVKGIFTNEEAALKPCQYGISVAQTNIRRAFMKDPDETEQEGAINLIDLIQEVKEGRAPRDPAKATRKNMMALYQQWNPDAPQPSPEDVEKALEIFMQQFAAQMRAQAQPAQVPSGQ